jgi:hypothetical protein
MSDGRVFRARNVVTELGKEEKHIKVLALYTTLFIVIGLSQDCRRLLTFMNLITPRLKLKGFADPVRRLHARTSFNTKPTGMASCGICLN